MIKQRTVSPYNGKKRYCRRNNTLTGRITFMLPIFASTYSIILQTTKMIFCFCCGCCCCNNINLYICVQRHMLGRKWVNKNIENHICFS